MQSVDFRSVDEFLDYLPADELKIVERLRKIIFDSVPGITEKLSYNVPFYKMNTGMFFIWPAAILWGKTKSYTGVRFGFQQGYLLADEINYLDKGERKQVYYKDFLSIKDIDTELLKSYIFEAVVVDEQLGM
ncbi:MAG: hypothetical protein K0Q79_3466 [Flavipsychrobacter sp.]|nr:hypothetical protein [Flavipsychrobacter sp.]